MKGKIHHSYQPYLTWLKIGRDTTIILRSLRWNNSWFLLWSNRLKANAFSSVYFCGCRVSMVYTKELELEPFNCGSFLENSNTFDMFDSEASVKLSFLMDWSDVTVSNLYSMTAWSSPPHGDRVVLNLVFVVHFVFEYCKCYSSAPNSLWSNWTKWGLISYRSSLVHTAGLNNCQPVSEARHCQHVNRKTNQGLLSCILK